VYRIFRFLLETPFKWAFTAFSAFAPVVAFAFAAFAAFPLAFDAAAFDLAFVFFSLDFIALDFDAFASPVLGLFLTVLSPLSAFSGLSALSFSFDFESVCFLSLYSFFSVFESL